MNVSIYLSKRKKVEKSEYIKRTETYCMVDDILNGARNKDDDDEWLQNISPQDA